jgi:hypothetical protein
MSDLFSEPTDDECIERLWPVCETEYSIDPNVPLWCFTWSPDPKELVDLLVCFLKSVKNGCICLEPTKRGNPHYHGWLQPSEDPYQKTIYIACVKTMQRFGKLDFDLKDVGHYRIFSFTKGNNALHYYKKSWWTMMHFKNAIITRDTEIPQFSLEEKQDIESYERVILGSSKQQLKTVNDWYQALNYTSKFYKDSRKTSSL